MCTLVKTITHLSNLLTVTSENWIHPDGWFVCFCSAVLGHVSNSSPTSIWEGSLHLPKVKESGIRLTKKVVGSRDLTSHLRLVNPQWRQASYPLTNVHSPLHPWKVVEQQFLVKLVSNLSTWHGKNVFSNCVSTRRLYFYITKNINPKGPQNCWLK